MSRHYCYLNPKTETRESPIAGKGTFANSEIKKGELIAAFGGKIINEAEYDQLPAGLGELFLTIDDELYIGPPTLETIGDGDFVNHSCQPNTGICGQIFLVAMQDIPSGDEITFDYAMVISDKNFNIPCACGSQACRKKITGIDWKIPQLQKKYRGFFSSYLERKIGPCC